VSAVSKFAYDRAAGNPFFIWELVRYIESQFKKELTVTSASIKLEKVLGERIYNLPPESRRMLEFIAVNGDPIPQSVLSDATNLSMSADTWVEGMASLKAGGLIRRRGLRRVDQVEIYHDRIRETILDLMNEDQFLKVHEHLARAMERWPEASYDLLARHWMSAGDKERARTYIHKAAVSAVSKFAYDRAANLYRMVLALEDNATLRVDLWKARGEALANAGKPAGAAKAYLKAVAGADAATRLEVQNLAAEQLLRGGYISQGIEAINAVLQELGLKMAATPRRAMLSLSYHHLHLYCRGLSFTERDPSEISRKKLTMLDVMWSVSLGLSQVDTIRVLSLHTKLVRLALKEGEPERISGALILEAAYRATRCLKSLFGCVS